MKISSKALIAVAEELGTLAKRNLPPLKKGEWVKNEWLKNNIYCRETVFKNKIVRATFDFYWRSSRISTIY